MANLDPAESQLILNAMFKGGTYTPLSTVYVAIDTTIPTYSASGTEASSSGTGYVRAALASANVTVATASGTSTATSTAALNYTNMPAGTFNGVEVYSASTGAVRRLWYGQLSTAKTLAAGDTLSISSGQFSTSLG